MVNRDHEVRQMNDEYKQKVNRVEDVVALLNKHKLLNKACFHHTRGDLIIQTAKPWYRRQSTQILFLDNFSYEIKPRLPYHIRLILNGVER